MDRRREDGRAGTRMAAAGTPQSGDLLYVTRRASVQFRTPMYFRVIRVHDWPTYNGWAWLEGYHLNDTGEAIERRSIFVHVRGLRRVPESSAARGHRATRSPCPVPR